MRRFLLQSSAKATLLLAAAVVGYFVWQACLGVNIENPSGHDLLRFGANFLPLTIFEPWRLVAAGFVHIGIMHLFFNVYALLVFGRVAEALLGSWRFLCLYFLAVVGASLASLYHAWYFFEASKDFPISAGASGGIMGVGAALLALSFSRRVFAAQLNKKALLGVMAFNLILGFALPGIDNAGHIGGAAVGLLLGLCCGFASIAIERASVAATAAGLAAAFFFLRNQVFAVFAMGAA